MGEEHLNFLPLSPRDDIGIGLRDVPGPVAGGIRHRHGRQLLHAIPSLSGVNLCLCKPRPGCEPLAGSKHRLGVNHPQAFPAALFRS